MKQQKKVCFLIPSLKSGGIETYLLRFLKYQQDVKDTTILVRNSSSGELYEEYKATKVKIVFKPLGFFNLSAMYWYYRFFKNERFDTVCDFNGNFAGLPMFLSKLAGVKKRITFYRQGSDHFKKSALRSSYNRLMNRLVFKFSTAIYANSSAGLKYFFPNDYLTNARFKIIKNGVNIEAFADFSNNKIAIREQLGLPKNCFTIGHVGRFTDAKNHFFLLDVVAELISQDINIYLVLVGNNTDQLVPYIKKLGIDKNVAVFGYQRNVLEFLKAFDLFFFPSITEGQPNALIEAMMAGLPIAASNIPTILECIPNDKRDCLIDPYDVKSTVEKIRDIRRTPENYVFKRHAIENFDAKIQFKTFLENL